MSLNATPSSERIHIGIFGRRNAGKSSVINAITGQNLAIVSELKGTTTDPVLKSMELLPLGPVTIIDTPGIDDTGRLGELRVAKAYQMLDRTDIALLVIDSCVGMTDDDREILDRIRQKNIPYVIVWNKADIADGNLPGDGAADGEAMIRISAKSGENIRELKEMLGRFAGVSESKKRIVGDLLSPLDLVVLVIPIDSAAPKGRIILPQQQTIRDILDAGAAAVAVRDVQLKDTLDNLGRKPRLVITDSQVFGEVAGIVPDDIPLTSFSVLMARYKGDLETLLNGVRALDGLQDGDAVLISEGCTHHRQCDDIGTVKLPRMIREYTGKDLRFDFTSGTEFPEDPTGYRLIVHCGGCMLNGREMKNRLRRACERSVPITNYGMAIAQMKGILERSVRPFKGI